MVEEIMKQVDSGSFVGNNCVMKYVSSLVLLPSTKLIVAKFR